MPASTSILPPPPADVPERDTSDRSIAIGVGCTLLFHILLVWLSPNFSFDKFTGVHSGISVTSVNRGKTFDFQLDPGTVAKPQAKDPFRFVETNSAAPENTPDKTSNFSNRNQQSAQEVAAMEKDPENRPSVKGQDEIKNDVAIVSGDMAPPQIAPAPTPEAAQDQAQDRAEQKARAEQVPLSGFEKVEGKSEDGIATNIAQSKSPSNRADQAVEGARNATDPTGGLVAVNSTVHAQPKERPRLTSVSLNRSTILTNRAAGVTNIGIVGQDARWSEYGEYLNRLIETVQAQWYKILAESRVSPGVSHVVITFRINSKGETEITKVEDSNAGRQAVFACQNAITYPQPYGKWSDAMIAVLGESQELTFAFYYTN